MILHIVPDDKFIDMAYNMFEKASPNNNEFMIVGKFDKFKYIKTTPITQVNKLEFLSKNFAKNLENYEFVVIHALIGHSMKLVLNTSSKVRFIWLGWGFDYYCFLDKTLLFSKTAVLKNKLSLNSEFVAKKYLRKLKRFVVNKFFYNGIEHLDRIFEKIDYFAPVLKEDYDLLSKHFQNFQPQYLDWNYGTLEDNLIKEELELSGKNILLGNSASYENNHIEAVDLICNLDLENRKVICPLSYGKKEYRNEIIKYSKDKLNDGFEALIDFMPIEEYNRIISSCSIVIMNHLRQQAVGNIVIMLYFGAKVFLNKENPVYEFFKNNGAIIFATEELTNDNINISLTEEEKQINKEVLKKYWTRDVMLEKTKNLIETMRKINA